MQYDNRMPLDAEHRHQQQTLSRLLLNHYRTATHGLPHPIAADSGGASAQCQRKNLAMVRQHVRSDARVSRADLRRIWAEVREGQ